MWGWFVVPTSHAEIRARAIVAAFDSHALFYFFATASLEQCRQRYANGFQADSAFTITRITSI
jgi:hypothetical protein